MKTNRLLPIFGLALNFLLTAAAQVPDTLKYSIPGAAADDNLGQAVALSGTRLVVGAALPIQYQNTAKVSGSVFVYELGSATPTVPALTLQKPGGALHDSYGLSVVCSGSMVVVGAATDNTDADHAGLAYVYDLASATPTVPVLVLHNPNPVADDNFGDTLAISGTHLAVGVPRHDGVSEESGIVYVYDLASVTPTVPALTLESPNPDSVRYFGQSVAVSGQRLVVGSPGEWGYIDEEDDAHIGVAYVYDLAGAVPSAPVFRLYYPNGDSNDSFGYAVATSGSRVVVGAYGYPDNNHHGIAYAFDLANPKTIDVNGMAIIVPVAAMQEPNPLENHNFGLRITMSGSRVLFGVPGLLSHASGAHHIGTAYLFDLASLTPETPVLTLTSPQPATIIDLYATSVAINGTTLAIGQPDSALGAQQGGAMFVYTATEPSFERLAVKGDAVPGAGTDPRIPADARWADFGVPVIDDSGAVAFFGKWKSHAGGSGSGIFGGYPTALIVKAGDPATDAAGVALPGVAIKTFQDPVAASGGVAFLVNLSGTGVGAGDKTALYYVTGPGGTRKLVAREGQEMPDTPGSTLNAIQSIAVDGGTVLFTGTLSIGPGGVTASSNAGAWGWHGPGTLATVVREGSGLAGVSASTVKSFRLLKAASGSADTGRGLWDGGVATFAATFADGSSALVDADLAGTTTLYASGTATVPGSPGAKWKAFGPPATPGDVAQGVAFLATLKAGVGGVTSATAQRLFFQGADLASVAAGDPAPGLASGAKFSAFKDPVISPGAAAFAFCGTAKLGGSATNGIWWQRDGDPLEDAVAAVGATPPAPASAVTWASFTSLATTDHGPVFTGKLAGATSNTDTGLWATDSLGNLVQILREGDSFDRQTIKNFTVLASPSTSQGARRSYTSDGHLAVRVTFTGGGTELVRIGVP